MEVLRDLAPPLIMGILLGGLYALIALGLSLVFGVMKLINVAHGDLVALGSYLAFAAISILKLDPILSLIIVLPVMFILGMAIQRFLLNRAFQVSAEAPLIIAFGLSTVLQNTFQLIFTPYSRNLNTFYALKFFTIGDIRLPLVYLLSFIAALIVMLFMREFLKRTYLGRAIKAASQNRKAAQLMGINPERVYSYTFGIAIASASIAGVFLGLTFPFIPTSGLNYLIIAFGVIVLGGLGSILGTFVGGIIFGLAQTLGAHYVGVAPQMLIAYLLVLVVLGIRPQGIFGR